MELERTIANILRELKDDELPTLFNITTPCVEGSYAGPGNGACASRGRVFLAGLAVIGRVIDEYKRRGVLPPHGNASFAPCGWLFETAPLRHGDTRPGVEELRLLYGTTMGAAAVDDAAFKGSAAHRSTQMYTNLGAADDWVDISTRGQREPRVPLERILRPGEYLQRWDESKLGPARPPSVAGQPPRRYPKIVRSLGSYAWRAQQLSAAQLAADARKPYMFSGRRHAVGVSCLGGYPHVPSNEMEELATGLPRGYTALTITTPMAAPEVCDFTERHGYLGDQFDSNLNAATLVDRQQSSVRLARAAGIAMDAAEHGPPRPPPGPPSRDPRPHDEERQPRKRVRFAPQPPSDGDAASAPGAVVETPPRAADGQDSLAHEEDPAAALEEEFAAEGLVPIKPAHRADRIRPGLQVPAPHAAGSEEDLRAGEQYARFKRWMRMRQEGELPPEALLPDAEFEEYVRGQLANLPEAFTPGNIHAHGRVWEQYFQDFDPGFLKTAKGRRVQSVIRQGLGPRWVSAGAASQQLHPRYERNMRAVSRQLTQHYQPDEVTRLLSGAAPGRVPLPNLKSVYEQSVIGGVPTPHESFIDEQVVQWAEIGTVREWWWPQGEPPECILPLGVVAQGVPAKLRIIWDGRYINLFDLYEPFSYESLTDLLHHMTPDGWISVSDFKAGYHHIALQQGLASYMGFCWRGTVYVFAALPFGAASACRIFTEVTQAMFQPLRAAGIPITSFIDDRASVHPTRDAGKLDTLIQFALMAALGWFVSILKCVIAPAQLAQFLGMLMDTKRQEFRIPEKKLAAMQRQIDEFLAGLDEGRPGSSRDLASIAGRVLSARLALPLAPLYCRELFEAISPADWDAPARVSDHLADSLKFVARELREHNGGAMWRRPGGVVFVGDAGEAGAGGFTLTGELANPVQVSYDAAKQAAIARHEYHSTAREVDMVYAAVQTCVEIAAVLTQLRGRLFRYITDSQSTLESILGMRPAAKALRTRIFELWTLCRSHDFHLTITWMPRWAGPLPAADGHTRMVDNSAWGMNEWAFAWVLEQLGVAASSIDLDPFSQEEFAKAPRWFSQFLAPGSAGVDGFLQRWRTVDGRRAFCFVNGPFQLMGRVLAKLTRERVDCVLVYPRWREPWCAQLAVLPVVQTVTLPKVGPSGREESPLLRGGVARREQVAGQDPLLAHRGCPSQVALPPTPSGAKGLEPASASWDISRLRWRVGCR